MEKTSKHDDEFWKLHLEKFSTFKGSVAEYCRQNKLRPNQFHYHRKRHIKKKQKSFAAVKVVNSKPRKPELPDPHWVAQVMIALSQQSQ